MIHSIFPYIAEDKGDILLKTIIEKGLLKQPLLFQYVCL